MLEILIVENEVDLARHWAKHLTESGYKVVGICGSAPEAIDLARHLQPDVILLDIMLDGLLDGYDAAAQLRGSADSKVIFMSAHTDLEAHMRAASVSPGALYIEKPFKPSSLVDAIEQSREINGDMGFTTDHDLLVRLETKLDGVTSQLSEARGLLSTKADSSRVEKLEKQLDEIQAKALVTKADVSQVEKLQKVVDGINLKVAAATGAVVVLEFLLRYLWK